MKYMPSIPIKIFPILLKSGIVFFWSIVLLVFLDTQLTDITSIFDTTNSQITIIPVLKVPTKK